MPVGVRVAVDGVFGTVFGSRVDAIDIVDFPLELGDWEGCSGGATGDESFLGGACENNTSLLELKWFGVGFESTVFAFHFIFNVGARWCGDADYCFVVTLDTWGAEDAGRWAGKGGDFVSV